LVAHWDFRALVGLQNVPGQVVHLGSVELQEAYEKLPEVAGLELEVLHGLVLVRLLNLKIRHNHQHYGERVEAGLRGVDDLFENERQGFETRVLFQVVLYLPVHFKSVVVLILQVHFAAEVFLAQLEVLRLQVGAFVLQRCQVREQFCEDVTAVD